MLEYRSTRGPNVAGTANSAEGTDPQDPNYRGNAGAGFRGPGESKLEIDKRTIKDRIKVLQTEIAALENQRQTQRNSRTRLGIPRVALVGYTNAGKSTVLNRLSKAGVLAEDMLFATLDPTTRKVRLPSRAKQGTENWNEDIGVVDIGLQEVGTAVLDVFIDDEADESIDCVTPKTYRTPLVDASRQGLRRMGMEVLLTDTVGFISKLPSNIVAAFRATVCIPYLISRASAL